MRLDVSIPRSSIDQLRKLLHPPRTAIFYSTLLLAFVAFGLDIYSPSALFKIMEIFFLLFGLTVASLHIGQRNRSSQPGTEYFLLAIFVAALIQSWWKTPYLNVTYFHVFIVLASAALYGKRQAFILVGTIALLEMAGFRLASATPSSSEDYVLLAIRLSVLVATVLLIGQVTSGQRRKILSLREELLMARSGSMGYGWREDPSALVLDTPVTAGEIDSLGDSVHSILQRIKRYFRAYSVLLYQPCGPRSLALRDWVSDSDELETSKVVEIEGTMLGRIFARGVSCNWNLEDPNSSVTIKEIPYYSEWKLIRHLAGTPLRMRDQTVGVLVVDRSTPCPFTELEIIHLETFAIQLVEMIHMGKLYLDQLDRNSEYRLFYRAMSDLGQSLATQEILESLANVCQGVVACTHVLIALVEEGGLSYEISLSRGAEKLKHAKVRSRGPSWISWLLNSETGPLLLRDIRSYTSRMPVVTPGEETLPVRSVLMLPLEAKGRRIGVLFLGSTQPDIFRNWHLRILNNICRHAAPNIENALLHRRVETEALVDGLTNVYNHRYFQERLKTELSRVRRNRGRLSLLLADIDHFKKVNDTYGHRIGDMVLQQIATILKGKIRSEDAVARYGGEEFVIILTESDQRGARRMAERLLRAVERVTFCAEDYRLNLSISIGAATFPEDAEEPWELIEHADRALYAAKEGGRNRVVQSHTIRPNSTRLQGVRL